MYLRRTTRAASAIVAVAMAWALSGAGTLAHAGLLDGVCSWWQTPATPALSPAPTYTVQRVAYMPVTTVAYSLPTAQTCYYQPEIRYRWVYSRVPRTTYSPVTTVDPCTGAVTTTYQPVTRLSLLPWLHREPYTTYRYTCTPSYVTSYAPVCPSAPVCDPCAGTVIGSSACVGCTPGVTTTPAPSSATTTPTLPQPSPPGTFRTEPGTEQRYKPEIGTEPAQKEQNTSMPKLRLMPPSEQTAAKPLRMATRPAVVPYVKPIPWNVSSARAASYQAPLSAGGSTPQLDVSGWHSVAQ